MSASVQSRNVSLGGVGAWLGWVETSHIAALTSHAAGVIVQRVMGAFRLCLRLLHRLCLVRCLRDRPSIQVDVPGKAVRR